MTKRARRGIPSSFNRSAVWDWGTGLTLACGLYALLYVLWSFFHWGNRPLIADIGSLPINLAAATLAWRASTHAALHPATRRAWRLLAMAYLLYWLGDTLWFTYEIVLHKHPFPSWADAGYLSFYPIMLWALLSFPVAPHTRAERTKFWLDAGTVLLAGTMIVWYVVLRPTVVAGERGTLTAMLALAYPVGDLVLLFGITAIELRRPPESSRHALNVLVAGLLLFFVADLAYGSLSLQGAYRSGDWPDTLWIVALFLMLVSAQVQYVQASRDSATAAPGLARIRPYSLLPYAALAIGYGQLLLVERIDWTDSHGQIFLGALVLTGLVVVRQVVAVRENARLLAERAASQSEVRFRSLVQNASDVVAVLDADGGIRYISPSVERVLGYTPAELVGSSGFALIHPDDLQLGQSAFAEALHLAGVAPPLEVRMRHRDGCWRSIELIGNNLLADPLVGGLVITARDMTERKQVEAALRESEERFRLLFEHSPDAIFLLDPYVGQEQWRIVACNDAACEMNGYTRAELVGHDIHLLSPGAWDAPARAAYLERLRRAGTIHGESTHRRKDGTTFPVEFSTTLRLLNGRELILSIDRDISERRRGQEALRQSQATLAEERALLAQRVEERTMELRAANAELARAATIKDEFLASMSHELRTPLNAVLGLSEALQEQVYGPLNARQLASLGTIEESGRHLLALINDILDLSKIEAGKMELDIGPVAVDPICQASLRLVHQAADQRQITFSTAFDYQVTTVQADARRLKQMLVNLLSNAIKFTQPGGTVGLEVTSDAGHQVICFSVWDTGIGIAADDLARLFQPFVQLDSGLARHYPGTGLGLALVRRMAEMHGGSVAVESTPGAGSRFTITLPWQGPPEQPEPAPVQA
jgi:PAS domain S-box-containing protein